MLKIVNEIIDNVLSEIKLLKKGNIGRLIITHALYAKKLFRTEFMLLNMWQKFMK